MPFQEDSEHILNNACVGVGLIPVAEHKGILHTVISTEKNSDSKNHRLYGGLVDRGDFPPEKKEQLKPAYLVGYRELLEEAPQNLEITKTFNPQRITNQAQPVGMVYRELPEKRLGEAQALFTMTYVIVCKMEELSLFTKGKKDGIEESPDHYPAIITPFSRKGRFSPQDPAKGVKLSDNYTLQHKGEYRALGSILNMYERGILYGTLPPSKIILNHLFKALKKRIIYHGDVTRYMVRATR